MKSFSHHRYHDNIAELLCDTTNFSLYFSHSPCKTKNQRHRGQKGADQKSKLDKGASSRKQVWVQFEHLAKILFHSWRDESIERYSSRRAQHTFK